MEKKEISSPKTGNGSLEENEARIAVDSVDTAVRQMAIRHAEELKDFLTKAAALAFSKPMSPAELLPEYGNNHNTSSALIENYLSFLAIFAEIRPEELDKITNKICRMNIREKRNDTKGIHKLELERESFGEKPKFALQWFRPDIIQTSSAPVRRIYSYDAKQTSDLLDILMGTHTEFDFIILSSFTGPGHEWREIKYKELLSYIDKEN